MSAKVIPYTQIDPLAWRRLVMLSRTGTWFQSPEAYAFYASLPTLMQPLVYAIADEEDKLRAVCVGYITRETNRLRDYFTRRAIIIGGPCLADDCTDEEVGLLMRAVRDGLRCQAIYIETRNFNDYSRWRAAFESAGFAYCRHLNFHVDCTDQAAMWERLSDNRKRQIRKAEQTVEITMSDASIQDIRAWYAILAELYKTKVKTPLWSEEFFVEAYRQGVGKFILVKHDGAIIGGSMLVELEGKCVYEWYECGLNAEYKEYYPSVTATFAGMRYAAEHGCGRYDMMGAGEQDVPYGVRDFKAEFGGKPVEHGRYLSISKPWLYRLGVWGVKILKRRR